MGRPRAGHAVAAPDIDTTGVPHAAVAVLLEIALVTVEKKSHRFCIAPMMDWTDRHDRYFLRLLSAHARLYTEMVTSAAVLHGDRERLLGFDPVEHPVALQLGGSDPGDLAHAARIGEDFGYDEINLNVGCPSDRVQSGRFGACLMREPQLVAECIAAMAAAVRIPVTVKCRIGVDDQDPQTSLFAFVDTVARAGCTHFIVHARKAWLQGLSPRENRDIPPLDYPLVYRLKAAFPDRTFVINGGIADLEACQTHLARVDGVMLGRAAYQTPYILADVDRILFSQEGAPVSRRAVVEAYLEHMEREVAAGTPLHAMTRHILGLYHGRPGARSWRRHLSENACRPGATPDIVRQALALVEDLTRAAA